MQYKFSPKLKMAAIVMVALGAILYGIGLYLNCQDQQDPNYIKNMIESNPEAFYGEYQSDEYLKLNSTPEAHEARVHMYENQIKNRPWVAFYVPAIFAFCIAGGILFFLCVQFVSNSGWSMVITRVMEGVSSYLIVGGVLVLIVILGATLHYNHIFHWMDSSLFDPQSENWDVYIATKEKLWLNTPFWTARSILYVVLWVLFFFIIKGATKKLDETNGDIKYFKKLYNKSVYFLIIFALTSAALAWDWFMSIDPHWYSTLYMWYALASYLVAGIAIVAMISIYLKRKGALPLFNDNHLHDLAKYMFGISLLWTYLWFSQFMLQWYANVPEETQYFQQRFIQYPGYMWMLAVNFLAVLLIMISSKIKRNYTVVFVMGLVIILGHYWDMYNMLMPGAVGAFAGFGALELGALLLISGVFIFVVFNSISRLNLEAKGHPYFHESEIYEYPF